MSALIGALRVSLSADTAAFQTGMKRAERQAKTSSSVISKSLGGIKAGLAGLVSGLSIGLLASSIKASLDYAGSLGEVAQQLGVTTRQLQVYRFAASQVGVSQQEMDKGLEKLNISLGKAKLGAKGPVEAFAELSKAIGKDIVSSSAQAGDALPLVAEALSKITDRSKRAAFETILMSKAGSKLDTVLSGGKEAIDAYAKSLEEMGGILSDEDIQKADLTADKIEQLNTQLKANIAGAVARNSNAILALAESLVFLISKIGQALTAWNDFKNALDAQAFSNAANNPFLSSDKRKEGARRAAISRGKISDNGVKWGVAGSSVTLELDPPKPFKSATPDGFNPSKILAGGGGSKKSPKGPKDNTARDTFQFEQDMRRAQIDILRAQQDLATDYVERSRLALEILKLERVDFERELVYAVASGDLTKARAEQLLLEDAKLLTLKQDKILQDEELDRQREFNDFAAQDVEIAKTHLEKQAQLAETASERRAIELRILDLAYREEKARLDRIIRESKDWAEIEAARRDLLALNQNRPLDQAGVMQGTRGPMEDWLAGLPTTAAKAQEAFEQLQVQGFEGLIDAALELSNGFKSAKEALLDTLKQFLLGLARMQLQKGLGSLIGSIKIPGFATGGSFMVGGSGGIDRNMLSLNGLPIARVSYGERVSVSNDNQRGSAGGRGLVQNFNFPNSDFDSFRRNGRQLARDSRRRLAIP